MGARYDDEGWTPEEFIDKYEYEGGIDGLLGWGGAGCFPPEIRAEAAEIDRLSDVIHAWREEHGY